MLVVCDPVTYWSLLLSGHRNSASTPAVKTLLEDPGANLGLADCLVEIGGEHLSRAEALYRTLLGKYANHPVAEQIKAGLTRVAHGNLRAGPASQVVSAWTR